MERLQRLSAIIWKPAFIFGFQKYNTFLRELKVTNRFFTTKSLTFIINIHFAFSLLGNEFSTRHVREARGEEAMFSFVVEELY